MSGVAAHAAINFHLSGSANGGTGTATLSFQAPDGNDVTLNIDNTSPILLDDGGEWNAPGITGFGFDLSLDPDSVYLTGWKLEAQKWDNGSFILRTIGASDGNCDGSCRWDLATDSNIGNLEFEYLPETTNGVKGALYNPAALETGALGSDPYFTDANLMLSFSNSLTSALPSNVLVRMQNVGENGEGSLKLTCEDGTPGCGDDDTPPPSVPEPATLALVMLGAMAGAGRSRSRQRLPSRR